MTDDEKRNTPIPEAPETGEQNAAPEQIPELGIPELRDIPDLTPLPEEPATQEMVPAAGLTEPPPAPEPPKKKKKKNPRRRKIVKRVIALTVVLAILGGVAWGLVALFSEKKDEQQPLTGSTYLGSIQSMVTGSGVTKPKDSSTVSCAATGVVKELFVAEGDTVEAGDPLFKMDTTALDEKLSESQKAVDQLINELSKLTASKNKLAVTAPFAGKRMEVNKDLQKGGMVSMGTTVATLVNDRVLYLKQYFSYAYSGKITAGMAANVSLPSMMSSVKGKVAQVNMIEKITTEGARLFEVVISVDNPGTLTEGVDANATIPLSSGTATPYESGKLEFSDKRAILAEAEGTCSAINMMDYLKVDSGAVLVRLDSDAFDDQIAAKEKEIQTAREALSKLQEEYAGFNATAPIAGKVVSCTFVQGEEAVPGTAQISIADTTTMYLEAQVDEQDIGKVEAGMPADISQYGENSFFGTVVQVSAEGKFENGVSFFPVTIAIEGAEGLMTGMYCEFSLVASQADNVVIAPIEAVQYTELGPCVFVREGSVDASQVLEVEGLQMPAGFVPVAVEVGLSDETGVEIVSGVEADTEVFTGYITNGGNSWEDQNGGMVDGGAVMIG